MTMKALLGEALLPPPNDSSPPLPNVSSDLSVDGSHLKGNNQR